jgi:hypothetical protein
MAERLDVTPGTIGAWLYRYGLRKVDIAERAARSAYEQGLGQPPGPPPTGYVVVNGEALRG